MDVFTYEIVGKYRRRLPANLKSSILEIQSCEKIPLRRNGVWLALCLGSEMPSSPQTM